MIAPSPYKSTSYTGYAGDVRSLFTPKSDRVTPTFYEYVTNKFDTSKRPGLNSSYSNYNELKISLVTFIIGEMAAERLSVLDCIQSIKFLQKVNLGCCNLSTVEQEIDHFFEDERREFYRVNGEGNSAPLETRLDVIKDKMYFIFEILKFSNAFFKKNICDKGKLIFCACKDENTLISTLPAELIKEIYKKVIELYTRPFMSLKIEIDCSVIIAAEQVEKDTKDITIPTLAETIPKKNKKKENCAIQ